jgi:serine/threonine protein kinase
MTSASPSADDRTGQQIAGKYRVVRLLGSGGMGSVYEAENVTIGKRVALKFLHMTAQHDQTSVARFQLEARAISAVESAHIVQVFDWGQDDRGQPFLVMELLDGRDLGERIRQLGRIPVGEATRFAIEALRGLRRVHAAGIVHRDLKPENLFLCMGDDDLLHVKIVDFGLSKLMERTELVTASGFEKSARLTQAGVVVGTPLYMAPEQVEGIVEVDHRADIWAMGAILFEMLAGMPPFMDRSYARLVMAICQKDPPDLARINEEVTPALASVVGRALTRDRDTRFQGAEAFLAALEPIALELGPKSGPTKPTLRSEEAPGSHEVPPDAGVASAPAVLGGGVPSPAPIVVRGDTPPAGTAGGPLDATIAAHTRSAATVWLSDAPVFSLWRGEVNAPDRLRIEARDGSVRDLRLEPVGTLTLGRVKQVGDEVNDLVYPDVASRLSARLRHDGVRWWLERRTECSVPVQVGTRALGRGEEAPLVHGTFVSVGAMRATLVDRRSVSRSVPAGTVDPASGLLARGGFEQEVATVLQQQAPHALVVCVLRPVDTPPGEIPAAVKAAVAVHQAWPSAVVARDREIVAMIARAADAAEHAKKALAAAKAAGAPALACGYWALQGEASGASSEVELAFDAAEVAGAHTGSGGDVAIDLRELMPSTRLSGAGEVIERALQPKNQMLLFGIEEQAALARIGPKVVPALEQELGAVITTQVGPTALVSRLAPGVLAACVPRKFDAAQLGVAVQCEWHARPPITDGKVELPRSLTWEQAMPDRSKQRAEELGRECGDAHGVLSALSGGLPYPIAGRVHAAIGASSAVERVKMLFDVLEGTWRFISVVLAAAFFAKSQADDPTSGDLRPLRGFFERTKTRAGLPLGSWRELARLAAKSFVGVQDDPIGTLAGQLLDVELSPNQTFDTLSNLLHAERNSFAHGHYNEARAGADVREFEQMTRTFLRALRPLGAWTLVSVQHSEPDLYGESQTVEFIDHTGPYATGARRRIGFNSPIRLAHVVYLARWRDGLVLPLDPWIRRIASGDRFDLYWLDHLPRPGSCNYSAVVTGAPLASTLDARRLPPLLRGLVTAAD